LLGTEEKSRKLGERGQGGEKTGKAKKKGKLQRKKQGKKRFFLVMRGGGVKNGQPTSFGAKNPCRENSEGRKMSRTGTERTCHGDGGKKLVDMEEKKKVRE